MTIVDELLYGECESKERIPNIYFVFEGTNTEPFFVRKYLEYYKDSLFGVYNIHLIDKKDNDKGRTSVKDLLKIANNIIKDKNKFDKKTDKVVVMFDLDIYDNDQSRINTLFPKINNNIILAYTNPAIELFIFLLIKDSLNNIIIPHKNEILENKYVLNKENKEERYIHNLLSNTIKLDVKVKKQLDDFDFSSILEGFDYAYSQEKNINRYLDCAANNLTSNICYILDNIKNKTIDQISYKLTRKEE